VRGECPLMRPYGPGDVTTEERRLGQQRQVLGTEPLTRIGGSKCRGSLPPLALRMRLSAGGPDVVHQGHRVTAEYRSRTEA
jgi:hypothetical protein